MLLAAVGAWVYAGRGGAPAIAIEKPGKFMGQRSVLDLTVTAPGGALSALTVALEQGAQQTTIFSTAQPGAAALKQDAPNRVRLTQDIGRAQVPTLKSGPATIRVTAERTSLFGMRHLSSTQTHGVQVRLEPPRVSVASIHHFVNHGGAEMVVYRATPADVQSGVRVGDVTYRGYPIAGAGVQADPALHAAFFALLYDQDLNTPISLFATDLAGNQATAPFETRVFPKKFRRSRIELTPQFLQRVVPAILENTSSFTVQNPKDLVESFLAINRDLRRENAETIARLRPEIRAGDALERRVPAARQLAGGGAVRRSAYLRVRRQGNRSAGAPGVRSGGDGERARARSQRGRVRARGLPRHLRQLRHRGSWLSACSHSTVICPRWT